jgi:lipopolysaccharide transport protein LptA
MHSSNKIGLVALVIAVAVSARAAEIAGFDTEQQFGYDFERSEVDFKNDTAHFYGHVRVMQGPNSIQAGQAVARAFRSENKQWEFQESVLVRTADARLSADSATAAFSDNVLVATRVEGAPAEFERIGASSDQLVRGRARVIEYNVAADTVTLTGNVWFGYGKDEVEAEKVIYSLRDERVRFDSGEAGRVRGVIRPRANGEASAPNSDTEGETSGNEGEA